MNDPVPAPEISAREAAAIVLLGCRVAARGRLVGASGRRAARAARAFHEGAAPVVIASGGVRWEGVVEAEALCRELVLEGVPRAAILLESRSGSTRQNASFVAELVREQKLEARLAVVTCDWHMPRALRCFRSVGLDAVGLSARSPEVSALRRFGRGARETISGWVDRAALRRYAAR